MELTQTTKVNVQSYSLCLKKIWPISWNLFFKVNKLFTRLSFVRIHSLATMDICGIFSKNHDGSMPSKLTIENG